MSGGKKKRKPVRITYSAGEVNRLLKETADDATKKLLLICIVAARDKFDLDADETISFADVMQRYAGYLHDGLLDLDAYSKSLYAQTGIDLRLVRKR
jgi:hypothetical protein